MTRKKTQRKGRAIVIGGGISGLAAAILLAERYRKVVVLERDIRSPAGSPEEAFESWDRGGVAQFRHSHAFLARLTSVLRERFPVVLDTLRANGALELPLTRSLPPTLDLGPTERGDGELVLLGCRRAAFEWALHGVASRTRDIELREGALVLGLTVKRRRAGDRTQVPRVTGVRLRTLAPPRPATNGKGIPWFPGRLTGAETAAPVERLRADLVVDAAGRRSRVADWLKEIGAAVPREHKVDTGIFYFTRFYRLLGGRPPGAVTGLVAGDVGWLKCATFPGDGNTFSITLGTSIDDRELRALSDPRAFEALIGEFPLLAMWRARGISTPIDGPRTPVLVMGGLANTRRRFVAKGAPLAEGLFAIGDAAFHTNPIYGRGATCALLAAVALADSLAGHPGDLRAAALDFDERTRRDIKPFWDSAAAADQMSIARAKAIASGDADQVSLLSPWSLVRDPGKWLAGIAELLVGLYVDRGVVPASRRDAAVFRAVMRVMNMLEEPRKGLFAPDVMARVLLIIARSLAVGPEPNPFAGPSRDEALAAIAAAMGGKRRARSGKRNAAQSSGPPLEPGSTVLGHA